MATIPPSNTLLLDYHGAGESSAQLPQELCPDWHWVQEPPGRYVTVRASDPMLPGTIIIPTSHAAKDRGWFLPWTYRACHNVIAHLDPPHSPVRRVHGTGDVLLRVRTHPNSVEESTILLRHVAHIPALPHNLRCHRHVAEAGLVTSNSTNDSPYSLVLGPGDNVLAWFRRSHPGIGVGFVALAGPPPNCTLGPSLSDQVAITGQLLPGSASYIEWPMDPCPDMYQVYIADMADQEAAVARRGPVEGISGKAGAVGSFDGFEYSDFAGTSSESEELEDMGWFDFFGRPGGNSN
ncbi:hypothetical protein C8A03DRAFT_37225 [Achaetomium macrosporum]|uniref:Uncharacterized protein n=1 Tax=Achaetomium macrosporum TaxID=79813 RepID=A0AAN7H909_9PEZI|nr:hypothetical protein C8A03DRAFT_37225 [Achaetomium macrosporum]